MQTCNPSVSRERDREYHARQPQKYHHILFMQKHLYSIATLLWVFAIAGWQTGIFQNQ